MNHSNNGGKPPAESEEGSPMNKENTHQPSTLPRQSEACVSQGLAGVRKAARENKELKFTALLHHVTIDLLRESFYTQYTLSSMASLGTPHTWDRMHTLAERWLPRPRELHPSPVLRFAANHPS
jgi:hypothetical protein